MATNRNNNRNTQNNRNNRANNKRISSDNEEQLELIKINVDKVKKDVTEVSVHTRKEISAITKKVDELITKLEQSMKLSASQSSKQAAEMLKQQNIMVSTANKLLDVSNKTLENEKKTTQQKKEQVKQQENITDAWLADRQQSKDNTNMILDAIKGKGSFSNVMLSNNNKAKDDIISRMRTIESSTSLSVGEKRSMMNELANQFNSLDKSAGKIQAAATIMDTSVKVVKIFLNTWMDRFNDGMNRIVNTYESTYSQQAAMTNMNQQEYFNKQREMQDSLNKQGLQNNVAISDVMQATADFVNNGITNMSQAMQLGEQSAIAKTLAPYLDTQSDAFVSLSQSLGPKFQKTMLGMNSYITDQAGQSRFVVKNMDKIINDMQYMTLAARKDLMGGDELAIIEELMKPIEEGGAGYTMEQALEEYTRSMDIVTKPYETLMNGDLESRIAAATIAGDPNATLADAMYQRGRATKSVGGGNVYNTLERGAIQSVAGTSYRGVNTDINNAAEILMRAGTLTPSGSAESSYNTLMKNFSNDQYTTAKDQKDILAESLALEYAIANEKWPDLMKAIKEIVPAIASMFATYIGGKLLGKIGGNLLGLGGKSAGGSLIGSALTSFAGTGLGYQAMGVGASMGINSVPAATAAGIALPAAIAAGGIAGGAYGISKGVEDWQSGNKVRGTISGVGGAAMAAGGIGVAGGMLAAGAANAWNPVGWGLLIAGGLAVAGTAISKATDTTVDLTDELEAEKDKSVKRIKDSNKKTIDSMYDARESIKSAISYEEAKNIALQSGIVSQEDLNKATDKTIDGLLKLADVSIEDQKKLNAIGEKTVAAYQDVKAEEKKAAGNQILELINTAKAGGRTYNDLNDEEKVQISQAMRAYKEWAISSGTYNNDKDVKWRVDKWGTAFDDDILSKDDFNLVMEGDNATTSRLLESFAATDEGAKAWSTMDSLGKFYGDDNYYSILDDKTLQSYIQQAYQSSNIDDAKQYLSKLKSYNYTWDKLPSSVKSDFINKFGDDIKSYAIGSSYIHGNGLAYLHEGEAVLTSTAAALLRSQTTEPISMAHGVSSALAANSSISKEQITSIVTAIQDQTAALIAKMDEIYTKILSNNYRPNYSSNMVGLKVN